MSSSREEKDVQSSRDYQQFVQLGLSMDLKGEDLVAFVERRLRAEEEARVSRLQAEAQLEARRVDLETRRVDAELEAKRVET